MYSCRYVLRPAVRLVYRTDLRFAVVDSDELLIVILAATAAAGASVATAVGRLRNLYAAGISDVGIYSRGHMAVSSHLSAYMSLS